MGASTANPTFSLNAFFAPQPSSELVFTKPQNSEPTSNRVLGLHTCTNEQFSYDMALHRIVEVLLFSLQSTFEMYICQARKAKKKKSLRSCNNRGPYTKSGKRQRCVDLPDAGRRILFACRADFRVPRTKLGEFAWSALFIRHYAQHGTLVFSSFVIVSC